MSTFILEPGTLCLSDVQRFIQTRPFLKLNSTCFSGIEASAQTVETVINENKTVYGINTGFGLLANCIISEQSLKELQKNIVLSHACGSGEWLDDDLSAMILLLKINTLAQGYSGVRLLLIEALMHLLNQKIYPCIPAKGSVGASGDLVPLAHMALPLLGVGEVKYQGRIMPAQEALSQANLPVVDLGPKEGLALLNGLQVSLAMALRAYFQTIKLFETAILAGSLSVKAAGGSTEPFDARIHRVRGQKAQMETAEFYEKLLKNNEMDTSTGNTPRVQDPYSLRCQPQIMGAVWHQIKFVGETLEAEINAVSDNPLVFAEESDILSGGNFHGEIIAMAADNLALAIAETGANAERRIALLIDKNFSDLPAFLVKESGLHSGFMIPHVTAAACASANKALAHPHSVDSIPTSANQEDHVSMATSAALRLMDMIDNTATILAIELLAACQGLEFKQAWSLGKTLQSVYDKVRVSSAPYDVDRYLAPDIQAIKQQILAGNFKAGLI